MRSIVLLGLSLFTLACRSTSGTQTPLSSEALEMEQGPNGVPVLPSITCTEGNSQSFSLEAVTPLPTIDEVNLLPPKPQSVVGPGFNSRQVRIDTCVIENPALSVEARRVIYYEGEESMVIEPADIPRVRFSNEAGIPRLFLPKNEFAVSGLTEAVFGDYSSLEVTLQTVNYSPAPGAKINFLRIKGMGSFPNDYAAVFTELRNKQGAILSRGPVLVAAMLSPGDFTLSGECNIGETPKQFLVKLGTATLKFGICTWFQESDTVSWRAYSLSIKDTHPSVAQNEVKWGATELKSPDRFQSRWGHHNGCDSFQATLPSVVYAASASEYGSCIPVVPMAPPPPGNVSNKFNYRVRYGNGSWISRTVNQRHFFFRDPPSDHF